MPFVRPASVSALLLALALAASTTLAADKPIEAAQADPDFAVQGEYTGELPTKDGKIKFGVQVIALGDGKFQAVGYHGGLPGDGYNGEAQVKTEGTRTDKGVVFDSEYGEGLLADGKLVVHDSEGKPRGTLTRVQRKSPTLGKKAPEGAVVLFDGSSTEAFQNAKLTEEGNLQHGTTSVQKFGDHSIHLEFRTPFMPKARGQGRGNSGVYLQGRYEVQVLDSFGLEGKMDECGGLYTVKKSDVNMCYPPLTWQTYDIDFTSAKYDDSGKLLAAPRITVRHNGVVVHNDVELPADRNTRAAPVQAGPGKGPLYLQNHGNPVAYRNIWVVEK